MMADTYAASAVCRTASVTDEPAARAVPFGVRGGETVPLPEPAELARLLAEPRPRLRWWQPALFEMEAA